MIGPVATILSLAANTLNIAGRWVFQVTTGDTAEPNIFLPTTDKTACDNLLDKNVSAPGTLSRDANVAIGFTITGNEAPFTFSTQRAGFRSAEQYQ
jgi:hypothetical protein